MIIALLVFHGGLPAIALDYTETTSAGLDTIDWEGGHTEFEMFDINRDGKLDILSIGDHGSPWINTEEHGVMVYFGDGYGGFTLFQNGNFGYGGIACGDVNNDGFADIGYGMHHDYSTTDFGDQLMEAALGDGTGMNWTPWDDGLASQGEDYGMFATDLGDIDNDGDLDFACTSFGYGNPLQVYRNQMDGSWNYVQSLSDGNCNMIIEFGDLNNDGNIDIATSYQNGSIWFGTGTGYFVPRDNGLPEGPLGGISAGDVNGDRAADIAFCQGGIQVYTWSPVTNSWQNFGGPANSSTMTYTAICDMDMDGISDIVGGGNGQVRVWLGDGAGQWTLETGYTIENDPDCGFEALRVGGDVDHNGYPDIIHLTDEGGIFNSYNHIRMFKETSAGDELSLTPLFPKGGEVLMAGSVRFIEWITEVPAGENALVQIYYSTTGAGGPWLDLTPAYQDNGKYQWTVPGNISSNNCYLKYFCYTASYAIEVITDDPFVIYQPEDMVDLGVTVYGQPIIIPAAGGSFDFAVELLAPNDVNAGFDFWIDVITPEGATISDVMLRNGVLLNGGTMISRDLTQQVPASAPAGQYTYWIYIGVHDNYEVFDDHFFFFEKQAGDGGSGSGSWAISGWGDEGALETVETAIPAEFHLSQNYPNPFNAQTVIGFELPEAGEVRIDIFDVTGRSVGVQYIEPLQAGYHEYYWDAEGMASGVYFYSLKVNGFREVKKMVLMK